MPEKPLLSVAIVIQNQRDVVESTLASLYELAEIPFELFLIDDGSIDGSDDAIQSLLDFHQHEHTFYFQHQAPAGRGNSLNEAIVQCNGQLFWAPETIDGIDENKLSNQLKKLANSTNIALLQELELPSSHQQWIDFVYQKSWPLDGAFIWNMDAVASADQFFNPYLAQYHGLEMASRLQDFPHVISDTAWYQAAEFAESLKPNFELRRELLFSLLRQAQRDKNIRKSIIRELQTLSEQTTSDSPQNFESNLLTKAIQMKRQGRVNAALELVEQVLEDDPHHSAARQLKIEILEQNRRFVQASELKHELSASQKKENEDSEPEVPEPEEITISLIIPTTSYGKPALEHCLLSISEHCDTSQLELIVIDNASLDDTHDYLDELKEKQFLHCRIITNKENRGFAASVNQALDSSEGQYACIIHNDVEFDYDALAQLRNMMDDYPHYAVIGPTANKTLNPDQATRNIEDSDSKLLRTEYLDSFCMMIRTEADLRMDETYELAFFEDIDLCFQARSEGHKVGIATQIALTHHFGTTTFSLGLDTESEQYWKNVAYFNEKWDIDVFSEEELKSLSIFDQLLALDDLVNPLYPEETIKKQFDRLFTDELKTEIFNTDHEDEILCKLLHLFMVMDQREVMRRLEDRLEHTELPPSLIYQLVRFYYNRNIYSRCTYYLDQLKPQNESLRADLYRLSILIENKEFDEAIPVLKDLMDHAPANPTLYKLAADIHKFNGNDEEAASFTQLARQINPYKFSKDETDAFGFEL